QSTRGLVERLASTAAEFESPNVPRIIQAHRAERLVLALDRLLASPLRSMRDSRVDKSLEELFKRAQSATDFDPKEFARVLRQLHDQLHESSSTKSSQINWKLAPQKLSAANN